MRALVKSGVVTAAIVAVTGLAGCGIPTTGSASGPQTGTNAPTSQPTTAAAAADSTTPEPDPSTSDATSTTLAFGQTFTWDNGISISVSKPKPFVLSQYAAGGEKFRYHEKFTITVVNHGTANFDPGMVMETVQSGDVEGDSVVDSDAGMGMPPMTTVLPGRQSRFVVGYGLTNPKDIVMEVKPGFEYDSAIFTTGSH